VIIDCIEFTERFRCGDAAAELAFLSMELESVGHPDLAAGLIARFAEASDDFGIYGVLDFYLSYRAWVRGKVAAFVAVDPSTPFEMKASKREEARRYFGLARSFSGVPLDRPFLIAVGGVIGSGKSTLATQLGRELGVPVVSSDRTRKLSAGLPLTTPADGRLYGKEERERTYGEVIRRGSRVIESGRGVILDATFSTHRWRQLAADAARAAQATFVFVETSCSADLLNERLAERRDRPSVSDATEVLLESFLREYEPPTMRDAQPCLVVETNESPEAATRDALEQLAGRGILTAGARRDT
jgi:predicted kinase